MRPLAVSLLCGMAHSTERTRAELWANSGLDILLNLLKEPARSRACPTPPPPRACEALWVWDLKKIPARSRACPTRPFQVEHAGLCGFGLLTEPARMPNSSLITRSMRGCVSLG